MDIGATSICSNYYITGSLYNVTKSYDSASLFTDPCGYGYGNWKTINYTNLQYPTVVTTGCSVPPEGLANGEIGVFWGFNPWGTGNPAETPLFSVPDDVKLVNPSWQTCNSISYGIWDPPIKLTKKTAMVPPTPTLSQQLTATPRSPISTPYGPATAIPIVEGPRTEATQFLPPKPPVNPEPDSPTGDPFSSSSNPTDNARPSEDASIDDPSSNAPSATPPSTQIHPLAQWIKGSASSSLATPAVNVQNPAPGPSPGPRLSVQPDTEDTGFALSLVAPIVMPQPSTVGGQIIPADPDFISLPATTYISGQSGMDIAGTPVGLDVLSQSVNGASPVGSTTIPVSAVSSGIFTVGGQVLTAKSSAIIMDEETIAPGGPGKTIGGTRVSLGSSGLLEVGSSTISLSATEQALSSGLFTVGEQVLTAKSNAIFMEGERITPGGLGKTIGGTQVSLGSSGVLHVGSSTISVSSGIFTVGGQVLTAKSSDIFMEGERITPGGPGKTVGGTQVSLGSSGLLDVGSSTISLSAEQALPTAFTVGSEVFTPNPTAISIDSTTITAGGPGVTVAGTPVKLQASGSLVISNSTFAVNIAPSGSGETIGGASSGLLDVGSTTISFPAEQALPTVFTVGSQIFTPNPTAISMDGTTITAGGPGVTVAGTPVELQASGSLVVGNRTFAVIPTHSSTSPASVISEGRATSRGRSIFFCGVHIFTICIVLATL